MRLLALWLFVNVLLTVGYQQTNAAPADSASTDEGVSGSDNCSPRPFFASGILRVVLLGLLA